MTAMVLLPDLQNAALQLGKWRYFLTGLSFAVLFGLICRAAGKLVEPFGRWRRFRGICTACTETDGQYTVSASFSDAKHLHHTVSFRTKDGTAAGLRTDETVSFAIRTEVFLTGSYAGEAEKAAENDGSVLLLREHRAWLRHQLLRIFLRELLICGIALAIFVYAMKVCFP